MNMGQRIKELRIQKGSTQEEVGKIIDVTKATIMKYEKGLVENLKRSSIEKLANYFNVTPSYLMCLDEDDRIDELGKDNQKQKNIFSKNLNYYLNKFSKTQMDLMNDLNLSSSTVSDWCNAKKYPRMGTVQMLADYFGILKSDLIEEKNKLNDKIPVLGIVKAGYDYLAEENVIGYVTVNDSSLKNEDFFALKVKGNSMVPDIYENDIAIIKKQSDFENGDYVVALINGEEATIKKGYKTDTGLLLQPVNSSFAPLIFDKKDIDTIPVKIIGVLYNITRSFK